jgi:hypothetical protein
MALVEQIVTISNVLVLPTLIVTHVCDSSKEREAGILPVLLLVAESGTKVRT